MDLFTPGSLFDCFLHNLFDGFFLDNFPFDHSLDLLVHVNLDVVVTAAVLAAGAGTFPSAKGLEARPCAGGCALRTVGIGYAGFDVIEEPG